MNRDEKRRLCEEADKFLELDKWLLGPQPRWRRNGESDTIDARWVIEEEVGLSRAYLAFRVNRASAEEPSVTLVFQGKPVCRVDIKPADEWDGNPPPAMALGLPAKVYGAHLHRWEHNRKYVRDGLPPDKWEIPIKQEISHLTQSLGQMLAVICNECRISFTPEQRDMSLPAKEHLI